ncbi:Efflux pump periplasmic linker BepF [bacterium BMS3Abin09]|nr:Efflux pump periplasmic linker BepF [bacterium BMS3Abin09]GBE40597.1 Efflux pump periplasmic linker BepF [bacterium BMS3Bbin09]HDO66759.1 efflux RND transporter periplasmic adaptor subunit [Nitrospirota bacterium]HEW80933.1 efflux RND transporter periplasmic adaptor subunit [Nitrospirota bacterium]
MQHKIITALFIFILMFSFSVHAEDKKQSGMPPAIVVVSEIASGMVAPQTEFVGTVFFSEVSDVACEVDGKVESADFEEGQRVDEGDGLVDINSDILNSDLDKAMLEYARAVQLYKEELITEEEYDARRFEKERLEIILSKKTVKAPFTGVIVKKYVERGEWLSPGTVVATVAADDIADIIVDVPEQVVMFLSNGMEVTVKAGGSDLKGKVIAVIPSGDISTRTFPVKIRVVNTTSLIEGMEARVTLPEGEAVKALTVNRDAVINMFGNTVVYTVQGTKPTMVPVVVLGYKGMTAGIKGEGLKEGMKVVIKGNERLRPGQEVVIK